MSTLHSIPQHNIAPHINGYAPQAPSDPVSEIDPAILLGGGILGALLDENASLSALDLVVPDYFAHPLQGQVFQLARQDIRAGRPADAKTIVARLGNFEVAPGMMLATYLLRLIADRPPTSSIPHYVDQLRTLAQRSAASSIFVRWSEDNDAPFGSLVDELRALGESFACNRQTSDLEFSSDISLDAVAAVSPYVVKGVVPPASTVLVIGGSGAGKTFIAMHMCGCVVQGQPFFGRRTRQGAALYVALEGKHGFGLRTKAWEATNGKLGRRFARLKPQITLGTGAASGAHVSQVIAAASRLSRQAECPVALIVIDTLACALTNDNENDAATIAAVMAQCDRIKTETGATVLLLHHLGKDPNKGPRGSSALRAAVDVMIQINREPGSAERTVVLDKVRDGLEGLLGAFTLRTVEFGTDEEGDPITSCVIAPLAMTLLRKSHPRHGTAAHKALNVLQQLVESGIERAPDDACLVDVGEWGAACLQKGLTRDGNEPSERKAFDRAVKTLSGIGQIETVGHAVRLIK